MKKQLGVLLEWPTETMAETSRRTGISVYELKKTAKEIYKYRQENGERILSNLIKDGVVKRAILVM